MRIGIAMPAAYSVEHGTAADQAIELATEATELGIDTLWFAQLSTYDAIGLAALVGHAVPAAQVGSGVVPIYPRHPQLMASSARTAQAATGGRFQLGVGLGAPGLSEQVYGYPFPSPITHLREYLTSLRALLDGRSDVFEGATLTSRPLGPITLAGAEARIPLLVAAMAPHALKATGELADGTITNLAGPRTLEKHIVPQLNAAAEAAGRPAPRVIATVAAVVTNRVEEAKNELAPLLTFYEGIPSYQRVLRLEGASALDLLAVGDEDTVADALRRHVDAGATEICVNFTNTLGDDARRRTWRLLRELA